MKNEKIFTLNVSRSGFVLVFSGADNSPVFSVASIFSELSRDSPSFCLWHAMLQSATMAFYPLKAFMESCSRLWDTNYNFRHKHSTKYEDVLWLSLFYLWSTCVQRLSIIRQQLVVVFKFSEDPQTMRPEQKVLVLPAPLQYLIIWSGWLFELKLYVQDRNQSDLEPI